MLVAVIMGPTLDAALAEIEQARTLADLVELRLDHFDEKVLPHLDQILAKAPPVIFTFRKEAEGGNRSIPEEERLALIERLLAFHPAYCDLEADTDRSFIARIAKKFPQVKLIGSYHDFKETSDDLPHILQSMKNPHFSLYKIALMAHSTLDMIRLMIFLKENSYRVPLCCISMGEFGKPSRVLGRILGNALDYSATQEENSQLHRYSLKTLHEIFHYRELNADTLVYSLIGDPVEQSPGHLFHNDRFRKEGINAVYLKMRLSSSEIRDFLTLIRQLPFAGLSVTIPLKEAILPEVDQIHPAAASIGAINTVTIRDHKTFGSNTDAPGALNAIERHLKVANKTVAILGAGGTARAIAYEVMQRKGKVRIFNRTAERAKELAAELNCLGFGLEDLSSQSYELLVNTTAPSPDGKSPIPESEILPSIPVMDVVYYPKETPLLQAARKRGCRCIYGEEMFLEQANLQQLAWKR